MTEKRLPAPDRYASCPRNGRVLEYYAGTFDAVYVCFNPFIRPGSIPDHRFCPDAYPGHSELLSLAEPVAWLETMKLCGLPSYAAVDLALKTQIHAIGDSHSNSEYAERLANLYDSGEVMPPSEGEHSPFLLGKVIEFFKLSGHEWAWIGDEFCTERKLYWLEDIDVNTSPLIPGRGNMFSPDKSILWTVHWDSHFTFLCGNRAQFAAACVDQKFEGFFCGPNTEVYWCVNDQ